jgi:hypothetical protein
LNQQFHYVFGIIGSWSLYASHLWLPVQQLAWQGPAWALAQSAVIWAQRLAQAWVLVAQPGQGGRLEHEAKSDYHETWNLNWLGSHRSKFNFKLKCHSLRLPVPGCPTWTWTDSRPTVTVRSAHDTVSTSAFKFTRCQSVTVTVMHASASHGHWHGEGPQKGIPAGGPRAGPAWRLVLVTVTVLQVRVLTRRAQWQSRSRLQLERDWEVEPWTVTWHCQCWAVA